MISILFRDARSFQFSRLGKQLKLPKEIQRVRVIKYTAVTSISSYFLSMAPIPIGGDEIGKG